MGFTTFRPATVHKTGVEKNLLLEVVNGKASLDIVATPEPSGRRRYLLELDGMKEK